MDASKTLPARPSLESLRKQAKKLARDATAGDSTAIARVRAHLPNAGLPLTQRNAQLIVAREYGYPGWQDLVTEVGKRLGNDLEWAVGQARRAIHNNDLDGLTKLLAEVPGLLSWRGDEEGGGLLGVATGAYGDAFSAEREGWFTRPAAAEFLIDAGAVVTPAVTNGLIDSRARGLLQLFKRKGLLPRTLKFLAALGDLDEIRATLDAEGRDLATINEAFICACRFHHEPIALLLLDRAIALDPELGKNADGLGRLAFVRRFIEQASMSQAQMTALGPWMSYVISVVKHAAHEGDVETLVAELQRNRQLLGDEYVWLQSDIIANATAMNDREAVIVALLDLDPAILRRQPPPPSQAIEFAITYTNTHLIPLLTRIWPVPDDLPHAAGLGDLAKVKKWFPESGEPLGDLRQHYPYNDPRARSHLQWSKPNAQQILDVALAFAVLNRHFEVADFLLEHGADINTNWNSHEPASILHTLVFEDNYESMKFLIDRGIDMTIKDYRWDSTAIGWARYGKHDEQMAQWLENEERERSKGLR
jgi:hypothetical protein